MQKDNHLKDGIKRAKRTEYGTFAVIELYGTWYEMGRQYGELAADRIQAMYQRAVTGQLLSKGRNGDKLDAIAHGFYDNYPYKLKELLRGMAETSGLDFSEHLLLNAVEVLVASELWSTDPGHCSGVAVWGEYSNGPLIYGRNYDNIKWFKDIGDLLTVVVYHPSDGALATATVGYAGCIYLTTGINEKGIFIALNNGEPSGGALQYHNRIPAMVELLLFLLDSPDLDQLESFFQTTRSNFAYVVGTADDHSARCFEWPVFDVKRRLSVRRPGLMVATNHFTEPSWGLPRPEDEKFAFTRTRRQNLLNLAEHFKGNIDVARMKKMLDTRLEELGATTESTVYQIVALPASMTLSLKVPGLAEWTDIPIGEHM